MQTEGGPAVGTVVRAHPAARRQAPARRPIRRSASCASRRSEDIVARLKHQHREQEAYRIALLKIRERGLGMKLARVEQAFDGSKLIFYFTADGRVDFRELVRELAAEFRTRIEMRQIGVRDEAKMIGGYGTCGRPLCCTTFLQTFEPVSIKMAKQQDLSLNPSKLSGLCGRLKCCLRYELPNAKGVVHGGCGSEGGCDNPSGCGTGGCGIRSCGSAAAVGNPRAVICMSKPRIAITAGDPAGIGPEVAARAAADPRVLAVCEPIVYGPPAGATFAAGVLSARGRPRGLRHHRARGRRRAAAASVQAIATAPVNKEAFRLAGLPWSGHTDLLAHLTGASHVAMMFYSEALRVVLATVHIPLAEVPRALTRASLEATIDLTARELPRFGIARPRIAVAGLNPHAGEHGLFGREEEIAIGPAIDGVPRARHRRRRGRFPATPCSCAPAAASSTSSSPAITIRD